MVDQTLFNWLKAHRQGKLTGAYSTGVSAEQMEIARLKAVLARVTTERDILGKGAVACKAASGGLAGYPVDECRGVGLLCLASRGEAGL